ncbi:hypothetical protein [Halomonas mongoliensis]|uniref:hypothetical protein n=1 Tax=Halomonas mongoliensis TaxID=321265 RepID=UPI00403AE7E7
MFSESSVLDVAPEDIISRMGKFGLGPQLIAYEAQLDEAKVKWLSKYVMLCEKQGKSMLFHDVRAFDSAAANSVTEKRALLRKVLIHAGVKVPSGRLVKSEKSAKQAQKALGGTVNLWSAGAGEKSINIGKVSSEARLQRELKKHLTSRGSIFIEEHIEGSVFRVLVVGGKAVACLSKRPVTLLGDGESSIQELLELKNQARKQNPCYYNKPIKIGKSAEAKMKRRGWRLETVLPEGEVFELRSSMAFSAGAEFVDSTDSLSPEVEKVALSAVASVPGLEVAGVDITVSEQGGKLIPYVLDVCCDPNIGVHHFPVEGRARNVAKAIWDHSL